MLTKIESLDDLLKWIPMLLDLHQHLNGAWEPEQTREQFLAALLHNFNNENLFFGEKDDNGVCYFVVVCLNHQAPKHCLFWLFYVRKDYRDFTKTILSELRELVKSKGIEWAEFTTSRTTRSYERWVSKFGAKKTAVTYKLQL